MKKKVFLIFFFGLGILNYLPVLAETQILEQKTTIQQIKIPIEFTTTVSASVEGYIFNIEGLTSPWSKVKFFSTQGNLNLVSLANNKGEFAFLNVLAPRKIGDLCFLNIDINQNASPPLCFSPPPPSTKTTITGLVLPPTLVLKKNLSRDKEEVSAWGKTVPNSSVHVYLFEEENPPLKDWLEVVIPSVLARESPVLTVQSDKHGEFSFNLPSLKSSLWRLFVGTQIKQIGNNPSPKSNTLEFAVIPWIWWWLIKLLNGFLRFAKQTLMLLSNPNALILLLGFNVLSLSFLVYRNRFPFLIRKSKRNRP